MYKLKKETEGKREYENTLTGTRVTTSLIKIDQQGNKWWVFDDLLNIPFIRKKAAEHVTRLYGMGMTKSDLEDFITEQKETLRGSDEDKYEQLYARLLHLESMMKGTDPIKQSLGLCTVYFLKDDESIDTWSMDVATEKMKLMEFNQELQAFFLNELTVGMGNLTQLYKSISQIALMGSK